MSTIKDFFQKELVTELQEKLQLKNKLAIPRFVKVVVNVGIGGAKVNPKLKEAVQENLAAITSLKPKITRASKAISGFKIRQGDEVGMVVTLRGERMYDFIYKLAHIVLPRMRDFRGLAAKGFDRNGNFNLGLTEQIVFPEISPDKSETLHGLSVSITTTAKGPHEGKALLEAVGFPFKKGDLKGIIERK